jgi:threonine dehydrogenase-like Zn-dependent dehydrogenase
LGHEAVGIIEDVGPNVKNLKPGDRVVISAVISCGDCNYCKKGEMSLCVNTNPNPGLDSMYGDRLSGIFGYSHWLGGFEGCQAEFVRVPIGDVNCLKIPDTLPDEKAILLSDIACTGWHANEFGEVKQGDVVAIWGQRRPARNARESPAVGAAARRLSAGAVCRYIPARARH